MFSHIKCLPDSRIHWIQGCNVVEISPHSQAIMFLTTAMIECFLALPMQPSSAVLGEHPEESPLHLRRPRVWSGGRLAVCHRPDIHGRLHQERAQTQPGEWKQEGGGEGGGARCIWSKMGEKTESRTKWITWEIKMREKSDVNGQSVYRVSSFSPCLLSLSRTLLVTNYSMQRRSPLTRRWWTSKSNQHFTKFVPCCLE